MEASGGNFYVDTEADIVAQESFTALICFINTVEPRFTATPALTRPPRYYGHYILVPAKVQSVIFLFLWPVGDRIDGAPL